MKSSTGGFLVILMAIAIIGCQNPDALVSHGDGVVVHSADLSSLTLNVGTLSPQFDPSVTDYAASIPNNANSVTVNGTKRDETATMSSPVNLMNLRVGVPQTASITVTGINGSERVYRVTATREPRPSKNGNLRMTSELSGTSGIVTLNATVNADMGVSSVELFLDGVSRGVLATPNSGTRFEWTIDTTTVSKGRHALLSRATDRENKTVESLVIADFDQPPILKLDQPSDGALVSGVLKVRGSFTDEASGTVVSVTFNGNARLPTSVSPFSVSYDLSRVPSGDYSLTVEAVDDKGNKSTIQRTVTVESTADVSKVYVGNGVERLLSSSSGKVLVQTKDGATQLLSSSGGDPVLLDSTWLDDARGWQVSHGYSVVSAQPGRYPDPTQVFLFEPSGDRRNISAECQTQGSDTDPVLSWPWLAWRSVRTSGVGGTQIVVRYFLYNIQSGESYHVEKPEGVTSLGTFSLAPLSTDTLFYFIAGHSPAYDLYCYSVKNGTSIKVTDDGQSIDVQSDQHRFAWQNRSSPPFTLKVASSENPLRQDLVTQKCQAFQLRDGLLTWKETDGVTSTLLVDDGSPEVLSLSNSAGIMSSGGGHVAFSLHQKLYVWDRTHGKRSITDALPISVSIDGDTLYLLTVGGAIYSVNIE